MDNAPTAPSASRSPLDYVGEWSADKALFPALCLGYVVVPPGLVETFVAARSLISRHAPTSDQAVVADFMAEGHFARHVRRMRSLYAERRPALSGLLDVPPSAAGMHLIGWLPDGVDDVAAAHAVATDGAEVMPLSTHTAAPSQRSGLLLGYAAFTPRQIRTGIRTLASALRRAKGTARRQDAPAVSASTQSGP